MTVRTTTLTTPSVSITAPAISPRRSAQHNINDLRTSALNMTLPAATAARRRPISIDSWRRRRPGCCGAGCCALAPAADMDRPAAAIDAT